MSDQADELRQLVSDCRALPAAIDAATSVTLVAAGNRGAGGTRIARELFDCLTQLGARSALFPSDTRSSCAETGDPFFNNSPCKQPRLIEALDQLSRLSDQIVIDGDAISAGLRRSVFAVACDVLMVTTPDDVAVLDTYTTLKDLSATDGQLPIETRVSLLVNHAGTEAAARDVHARIARAAKHFLKIEVHLAGCLLESSLQGPPASNAATNVDCDSIRNGSLSTLAEKLLQRSKQLEKQLIG